MMVTPTTIRRLSSVASRKGAAALRGPASSVGARTARNANGLRVRTLPSPLLHSSTGCSATKPVSSPRVDGAGARASRAAAAVSSSLVSRGAPDTRFFVSGFHRPGHRPRLELATANAASSSSAPRPRWAAPAAEGFFPPSTAAPHFLYARRETYHSTARAPKAENETAESSSASSPAADPSANKEGGNTAVAPDPPPSASTSSEASNGAGAGAAAPAAPASAPGRGLSSALVGDQMTVIAVSVLTLLLILSPALVDRIRNREGYDDFFNFDDPIDDLTLELYRLGRDAQEEAEDSDEEGGEEGSGGGESGAVPRQKNVVENLLREVFQSAALQQAAQQFVVTTLQSDPVREALQRLLKELAMDLLQDPETIAQVVQLLNFAIQNDQVRRAAQLLVVDLVNDPSVRAALVSVIQRLGHDGAVQEAGQALLRDTAHAVLNDEDVMDHSMEFATDVLGDDVVQQTAGEALRNTVGHAVRPAATSAVWVAAGLAWMAVAFLALGYANHHHDSGSGGGGISRGLEVMDRSLSSPSGNGTGQRGLMNLLTSLPGHILSLLLWPIQRAGAAIRKPLVALGRAAQDGTGSTLNWVISLASRIVPSREFWSRVPTIVAAAAVRPFRRLGRLVGSSLSSVATGLGGSLSNACRKVSESAHAGVATAGAFVLRSSSNLFVRSAGALRHLAEAAWSSSAGASAWAWRQLGRSVSCVLSRASTALESQPVWSACRAGIRSGASRMGQWTGRINDALADWALAAERFLATHASRFKSTESSKMNGAGPP